MSFWNVCSLSSRVLESLVSGATWLSAMGIWILSLAPTVYTDKRSKRYFRGDGVAGGTERIRVVSLAAVLILVWLTWWPNVVKRLKLLVASWTSASIGATQYMTQRCRCRANRADCRTTTRSSVLVVFSLVIKFSLLSFVWATRKKKRKKKETLVLRSVCNLLWRRCSSLVEGITD